MKKLYDVSYVYFAKYDFQNIKAESREEAIEKAKEMLETQEWTNGNYKDDWFAEMDEEEEEIK